MIALLLAALAVVLAAGYQEDWGGHAELFVCALWALVVFLAAVAAFGREFPLLRRQA